MTDQPAIRDETQKETLSGILGALQRLVDWVYVKPKRLIWAFLTLIMAGMSVPVVFGLTNPTAALEFADSWRKESVAAQLRAAEMQREGAEIDRFISGTVEALRYRLFAARSVVRVYVFERGRAEQLLGITDVFESMDPLTEATGLRDRPLPLASISQTIGYMNADPGNPRCIAANTEEYDDEELRQFLSAGGLAASAACPIRNRTGRVIGLLAVSTRSPLDENPELVPRTRDAALILGGYVERSPAVAAAIKAFQEKNQ